MDQVNVVLMWFQTVHSRTSKGIEGVSVNAIESVVDLLYYRRGRADALFSRLTSSTYNFRFDHSLSSLFGPITG